MCKEYEICNKENLTSVFCAFAEKDRKITFEKMIEKLIVTDKVYHNIFFNRNLSDEIKAKHLIQAIKEIEENSA